MKNSAIPILSAICIILLIIIIVNSGKSIKPSKKISPATAIEKVEIDSFSLATPVHKIDNMMVAAKFECIKSGNSKTIKNSDKNSRVSWSCDHKELPKTKLYIIAINDKITSINRNGAIDFDKAAILLDYIDEIKSSLNTRETAYLNQTPRRTSFSLSGEDDGVMKQLKYSVTTYQVKGEAGKMIDKATLHANILVR